ncbi:MAG: MlaD family protein [Candidatus Kapaibacteriales bacterium]
MKDQKNIELKVGIFSIVGTILLIIGLIVGRGYKVSVSMQTIKLRFANSAGLQISSPVVVNGVKRGVVDRILNDQGGVLVYASIDNIDDLRKDVRARISMLEVTGGKKIEIFPGTSKEHFDPEFEIPGETASDIPELVTYLGELFDKTKILILRLDTTLASANQLIKDGKFIRDVKLSFENANQILTSTREILDYNQENIKQTLKDLRQIISSLKRDYSKYEPRLDNLTIQLDQISQKTNLLLTSTDNSLRNVDSVISQINSILGEIKNGQGIANRLIYDKAFSLKLDSTLTQINELIDIIRTYGVNVNLRLGTRP